MTTLKICGITRREQAEIIADLGVDYLGFVVVPHTPRYVSPEALPALTTNLPQGQKIGVFRQFDPATIYDIAYKANLDGIQLHGQESLEFCQAIKELLPDRLLIKAVAIKQPDDLLLANSYSQIVDIILLDVPKEGKEKTIDWQMLRHFRPTVKWWLAGGLNPANVKAAIDIAQPDGIDLASGVEDRPGVKNIAKIKDLLSVLR
jgi:phosphoribosylanthranilate isomerase